MEDKEVQCINCQSPFTWTAGETPLGNPVSLTGKWVPFGSGKGVCG
jgi:hypothetical protein